MGAAARFDANVAAIRTLKDIETEGRWATPAEQAALAKYSGFGDSAYNAAFEHYYGRESEIWRRRGDELRALTTEDEYKAIKGSRLNAFYTTPEVIQAMWKGLERLGIDKLKAPHVIEPSAGSGRFLGFQPTDLAARSQRTAVELDSLTGRMLRQLYPNTEVYNMGYEAAPLPRDSYDVAISNVPFGNYPIFDPSFKKGRRKLTAQIHNYFFAKTLERLRPGGVLAFVTSHGTLDAPGSKPVRDMLAQEADLVAAVRLPRRAFPDTDVVTDILYMRKRMPGEPQGDTSWTETRKVELENKYGDMVSVPVNAYILDHPQFVLGEHTAKGTMRQGQDEYSLEPIEGADIVRQLDEAMLQLPANVVQDMPPLPPRAIKTDTAVNVREFAHVIDADGVLRVKQGGLLEKVDLNTGDVERVKGMLSIRDAARNVIQLQLVDAPESDITAAQKQLNDSYDSFVAQHGALRNRDNAGLMKTDPDGPFLLALEQAEPGKVEQKEAWQALIRAKTLPIEDGRRLKMPIFTKRTLHGLGDRPVTTIIDAMNVAFNETGRLDFYRMAQLLGKSEDDVITQLAERGEIFKNPEGDWEIASQYLSGEVRDKLRKAEAAASANPRYKPNVEALSRVQPKDLKPSEVSVSLGAPWVGADVVNEFVREILRPWNTYSGRTQYFTYLAQQGQWVTGDELKDVDNTAAKVTWGTPDMPAQKLLLRILNGKLVEVTDEVVDEDGKKKAVRDVKATIAAQEKAQAIENRFKEWVWEDADRADSLLRVYNDTFNGRLPRRYDGSQQVFPGMDTKWAKQISPHQKDAVWRVVQDRTALLAHEVGFGKAESNDAKVLTPFGWKRMGDIQVGDYVVGDDGLPTQVRGVYPQGVRPIFKVTMSDGAATECTDEHLWLTWTYQERTNWGRMPEGKDWECAKPHVRELSEIRRTLKAHKIQAKNHSIPLVEPVAFPTRPMPLDPYLVGVLIGDGHLAADGVSISSADPEIITTVRGLVPVGVTLGDNGGYDHQLTIGRAWAGKPRHGRNPVLEAMREMGLAGCKAAGKFVPDCYKFNDASSRLAILQGLMDTDGTVFKNGLAVSFTSVSQRLAEDVRFLVQSFGGTATIRTRAPTYTYNGGNYGGQLAHEVLIRLPAGIAPFRLSRKAKRVTPFTKYPPVRYITDVQPVGDKPATCILVDNPTHLYVTDDFIVTHNTAVMVTAGMELRRLGLSRKNLYVVPKLTHAQMQRDFTDIYPYADVLFPNDDDFTPAKRQEFASRISTGDWDAVILTYEQFEKLPLKPATEARFIEDEIDSYEAALVALDQEPETDGGYYRRSRVDKAKQKTMKQLEESLKKLRVKLQDVRAKIGDRSDQAIYFEELGIDQIFVDEADNFKSLPFATNMGRIKGLPNSQSQRAWNMYAKTRYLQELGKGHGVVFATGTPVANTIAEMYTMMRYLQQPTLEAKGIQHFDAWAKTFGETVETLEQTPQGTYRMTQRFAKFQNAPELSQLWQDVADIRVADETPEIVKRRPRLVDDNGKNRRTVVAVEPDAALLSYMTGLVERADRMKDVPPEVDNMLKLSSDARKAALDVRMVDPTAPGNPNGKIAVAAKNVARIYRETNADKGTQLIFLDMGTPKAKEVHDDKTVVLDDGDSGEDETAEERALLTNTYAALKDALIEAGVKAEDIAFIHDAKNPRQKVAIQNKVNDGTIRVIIGSTSKMGVGLNIQERAAALHHLDAPWRPRDIEQREGRVIRQKNKVYGPQLDASGKVLDSGKGVRIYSYVTEKSFDGFMWQAIEAKSKAIKAIMRRDNPPRVIDDIDDFTMSAAEAKAIASGDPDVMKRVSLQNAVTRLQMLRASHQDSRLRAREALAKLPGILAEMQSQDAQLTKDADLVSKAPDEFAINIKGQHMTERPDAGEALRQAVASSPVVGDVSQATVAGAYKGFDVKVANLGAAAGYTISLINPATGVAHSIPSIPYSSLTAGVLTRVENRANGLKAESEKVKQAIKQAEADQKGYAAQATTPFEYEDRLQVMESELSRLSRKLQGEQVEDTPSDNYVLPEEEEIKPAYHFGEPERELNSDAEIQAVEAEVEPVEKTLEVKAPPANMEKIIDRLDDPMKGTAAQLSLAGVGPPPQVQMFAETPIGGAEPQAEVGMRPLPGQEPLPVREVAQASQPVSTTETQDPEFADFGKAVKVKTRVAKNKYEWTDGIIQRTLNDGKLYEVKMAGEDGAIRLPSSDVMFAAPKPPAAPAAAKEPWQMTEAELYRGSYGKIPIINELNPSLLREKFADLISDRPGGTAVGLRGIYTPELGKTKLRRSFQSPDGVRDYRLGGTSTLEVAGDWKYEADSVIDKNIQRALKHPHGYGDTPYLAVVEGFRTGEEANDIGEIIIGNARVVAYVRNPTYNHSKAVAAAVSEGKPVPAEVLADYPELAAKAAPAARAEAVNVRQPLTFEEFKAGAQLVRRPPERYLFVQTPDKLQLVPVKTQSRGRITKPLDEVLRDTYDFLYPPQRAAGAASKAAAPVSPATVAPPAISKPRRKPKTPKKGKRALKAELKTVHEARSARSQAADEAREHSVILDVDDPRVAGWRLHGGRYDVQGVDTPPKRRPQKQTRRTTPRRAAMVTLQERR